MANDEPSSSSLQLVLADHPSAVGFPLGTSPPDSTALVDLWTRSTAADEAQIESYFTFEDFVRFYRKMEEVETSWMEEDIRELYEASAYGTTVVGYCYAIWNRLFDTLIKIGMTKRTPEIRVKELSGTGLPEPFEIVAVLECRNPALMERAIHAHYDSVRKYGKKKEFFTLTREEVAEYFKSLTAVAMEGPAADPLSKKMKKNRSGMPSMGMEPSSGMDRSVRVAKSMSMYLSVQPSTYEELFHKHINSDVIYSREFNDGTLYCVVHTNPEKNHRTLENAVKLIEAEIEPGSSISKFQCISNVLSQKVKTFAANQHMSDELFCAIFTGATIGCRNGRKVHTDVRMWVPPSELADSVSMPKDKVTKKRLLENDSDSTVDGLNAMVAGVK
jgi:hypothetical protein